MKNSFPYLKEGSTYICQLSDEEILFIANAINSALKNQKVNITLKDAEIRRNEMNIVVSLKNKIFYECLLYDYEVFVPYCPKGEEETANFILRKLLGKKFGENYLIQLEAELKEKAKDKIFSQIKHLEDEISQTQK